MIDLNFDPVTSFFQEASLLFLSQLVDFFNDTIDLRVAKQ